LIPFDEMSHLCSISTPAALAAGWLRFTRSLRLLALYAPLIHQTQRLFTWDLPSDVWVKLLTIYQPNLFDAFDVFFCQIDQLLPPTGATELKLVDDQRLGFSTKDNPPSGEICIRGMSLAQRYLDDALT